MAWPLTSSREGILWPLILTQALIQKQIFAVGENYQSGIHVTKRKLLGLVPILLQFLVSAGGVMLFSLLHSFSLCFVGNARPPTRQPPQSIPRQGKIQIKTISSSKRSSFRAGLSLMRSVESPLDQGAANNGSSPPGCCSSRFFLKLGLKQKPVASLPKPYQLLEIPIFGQKASYAE